MDNFEDSKKKVSQITSKCIRTISLCLRDTENVVSIATKMLEKKNANSFDLQFLKNEYLIKIRKLEQQYSNMSEQQFHSTIHANIKELNEIYKNVGNKLLQIIKNNEITDLSKVMTNMPLLVSEMFSSLKDYAHLSVNEITAAKQSLNETVKEIKSEQQTQSSNIKLQKTEEKSEWPDHKPSTFEKSNAPTRIVFNPGANISTNNNYSSEFSLNDNMQYMQEGLWSGMSTTLHNAWKILSFSSHVDEAGNTTNPVTKALNDFSASTKTLSDQAHKSFNPELAKTDPSSFLKMCGDFFTSDAFKSSLAGLVTTITIVLLLRKAYRRIRDWLKDTYHKTFD